MFQRISKSITLTIFACAIFLASCGGDEAAPSKRLLLTGKVWTITQFKVDGADLTDDREDCELDNAMIFFEHGTFIDDTGILSCSEFETGVEGTWKFKANETIISIRAAGKSASDWNVHELTSNTLRISQYVRQLNACIEMVMTPK